MQLLLDTAGTFGGKLLAITLQGEVWAIDAHGSASLVASNTGLGNDAGAVVVPNNPSLYGPLAGKLLGVADGNATGTTVAANGALASWDTPGLDDSQWAAVVPQAAHFFTFYDLQHGLWVADGWQFAPIQGQLVTAQEETHTFSRVWWNGSALQSQTLSLNTGSSSQYMWEQASFLPAPLGSVGTPREPSLAGWTIYLDSNHNGQLDSGEPFRITDSQGNYAFTGLTPGTYTVAEVPQAGWQQKAPAAGSYTVSVSANQTLSALDFGNQPTVPQHPGGANNPPAFRSTAPTIALVGQRYLYAAQAADPDGDPLSYDLPVAPAGMTVDPSSGVVAWTPVPGQQGSQSVLLRVQDGWGGVALQPYTVVVSALNHPPVITSTAPTGTASLGESYQYPVTAQDPDNDPLTYQLLQAPSGMAINATSGLVSWTPGLTGSFTATVQVADGRGGLAQQSFTVNVATGGVDLGPGFLTSPPTTVELGLSYGYVAWANDSDGDRVTYSLSQAPAGMTVSTLGGTLGVVNWTPTASQLGANTVTLQASDSWGHSMTQSFVVNVVEKATAQPPVMTSTPPLAATVGQVYAYNLTGTDPGGCYQSFRTCPRTNVRCPAWSAARPWYRCPVPTGNPAQPGVLSAHQRLRSPGKPLSVHLPAHPKPLDPCGV